jgi:hypothetical protein
MSRSIDARPSAQPMAFPYEPLLQHEVRLVELLPSPLFSDIIECNLRNTSLLDKPSYEALSYVWNEPRALNGSLSIMLHDRNFQVTGNLESALRHLRFCDITRELWIDAICINQLDIQERNLQVRRMKDIYESAKTVVIWLGPDQHRSDEAITSLSVLYREYHTWSAEVDSKGIRASWGRPCNLR